MRPPQPTSPSSVCGASTSTFLECSSNMRVLQLLFLTDTKGRLDSRVLHPCVHLRRPERSILEHAEPQLRAQDLVDGPGAILGSGLMTIPVVGYRSLGKNLAF